MGELIFTKNAYIWHGGFYELALEIDPPSDDSLFAVLLALWKHPALEGCYLASNLEPSDQERITPSKRSLQSSGHLYGLATVPNGKRIACGSFLVREEDGSDWLGFYLPMGSLSEAYAVGAYPFGDVESSAEWQTPVDAWLTSIAVDIYHTAPFQFGLIGMEVSGYSYAKDIAKEGIPSEPRAIYLWPVSGQLQHFPRDRA